MEPMDAADDAATKKLPTTPEPQEPTPGMSRGLLITLIALAGALLVAIGVTVGLLLSGGNQAQPEPTVTDSETPEPAPLAQISEFSAAQTSVECVDSKSGTTATVTLRWTVVDAERIALGVGVEQVDALDSPAASDLPPTASAFDGLNFDCTKESLTYSLTAANVDGERVHAVVVVERDLLPPPVAKPAISELAWNDGFDYAICASFDSGLTVEKGIRWKSTPGANSVSVYVATDPSGYPSASASFTRVASGQSAEGAYPVKIDCGTLGHSTYFAVKIVAENASGKTEKIITGNTAS